MVKCKLTDKELNQAYNKLNELDKSNLDTNFPFLLSLGDKELQFKFDSSLGRKGAWILATDFDIEFTSDDDFDIHL